MKERDTSFLCYSHLLTCLFSQLIINSLDSWIIAFSYLNKISGILYLCRTSIQNSLKNGTLEIFYILHLAIDILSIFLFMTIDIGHPSLSLGAGI